MRPFSLSVFMLIVFFLSVSTYVLQAKNTPVKTPLNAAFLASEYTIVAGECIDFTDMTTGGIPTSWTWSFPGAETPSSSIQNPSGICYLIPGEYPVVLEVQNDSYVDQEYIEGAITVLENTESPLANFTANQLVVPEGGFVTFTNLSQNNPVSHQWTFQGGVPETLNEENPPPIAYLEEGLYDVHLLVEDEFGQQSEILRENYIKVLRPSNTHPVADFVANRTYISPEESTNFTDRTTGNPYRWSWHFEGGEPAESNEQNPQGIFYPEEGAFDVMLIVENSMGKDTVIKENYIIVADVDPCTDAPIADFRASQRLVKRGTTVYFEDKSQNYPSSWSWYFEGGFPTYSPLSNVVSGVEYNQEGIFRVTLFVNNSCGTDQAIKNDYIFVFSGPVPKYCDTITNIASGETIESMQLPGSWGQIGGHNGERITTYADKFDQHSFTQIEGLIVPVARADYADNNAKVTFKVWAGSETYPDSLLYTKDVYLRNLNPNFYNYIKFDNNIEIDGDFFVGYSIRYNDVSGNGISDDRFVVDLARNRSVQTGINTLFVEKNNEWKSAVETFNVRTSTGIMPIACLVDIKELKKPDDFSVYPNPASSEIFVNTSTITGQKNFEVFINDMTGRQVYHTKKKQITDEFSINTENLKNGMYFISLRYDDSVVTQRFIILQ